MDIIPTRHGLRLSQHGVVISELRTSPGPTQSVFDVLAGLVAVLAPAGPVGMLGFAGGGMLAPFAALGWTRRFAAVDLDREAYELFRRHCPHWTPQVDWHHADAVAWLCRPGPPFGLLLDDLSVPADGDVFKPAVCWETLPALMQTRLRSEGVAVFNLLLSPGDSWGRAIRRITGPFAEARVILLDDFENRLLIAGTALPSAREIQAWLHMALLRLRSRQARRFHVRTVHP